VEFAEKTAFLLSSTADTVQGKGDSTTHKNFTMAEEDVQFPEAPVQPLQQQEEPPQVPAVVDPPLPAQPEGELEVKSL
jgi:hypothetical protein